MKVLFRMTHCRLLAALLLPLVAGCTLGPDYHRPATAAAPAWRENAPWAAATPVDTLPRGAWWQVFADPTLDALEQQALQNNQELKIALARLAQARTLARTADADLWPRLDLDPSAQRTRAAEDLSATGRASTGNLFRLPFDLSYEIDLWGRVRRASEAAGADLQASTADVENVRLLLQTDLARSYFALRTFDRELELLRRTRELRQQNLNLVQSLFRNGQVSRLDVARAEAELAAADADLAAAARSRALQEHRLAVLCGQPVAALVVAEDARLPQPPAVAAGLPSQLLERRPDIAAAERRLVAANARIGVAKAAFFPAIRLTGSAGWASTELSDLFAWDNRTWALGPLANLPLFDGGRNQAALDRSRAVYDEQVASYRQQVLVAFREVEDALSDLRGLDAQAAAQERALAAAQEAAELTTARYRAGLVSYLEVVLSERQTLASERQLVQLRGQQLQADIGLIKALGGGWSNGQ